MLLKKLFVLLVLILLNKCAYIKKDRNYPEYQKFSLYYKEYLVTVFIYRIDYCNFKIKCYNNWGIKISDIDINDSININYLIDESMIKVFNLENSFDKNLYCCSINDVLDGLNYDNLDEINSKTLKKVIYFNNINFILESNDFKKVNKKVLLREFKIIFHNDTLLVRKIR